MSIDKRTRVDGEVDAVDPTTCFEEVLPAAFERERELLARRGGRVCTATTRDRRRR